MTVATYATLETITEEVFAPWVNSVLPGYSSLSIHRIPGRPDYHVRLLNYPTDYRISSIPWTAPIQVCALPLTPTYCVNLDSTRLIRDLENLVERLVQLMHFTIVYERGGYC